MRILLFLLWGLGESFMLNGARNLHAPASRNLLSSSFATNEALLEEVQKLRAEVALLEVRLGVDRESLIQAELDLQRERDLIAEAQAHKDRIRAGARLVAMQMQSMNATSVELVLFNDPVNTRERVSNILQSIANLSEDQSHATMMSAHKGGHGVVTTFDDDQKALEAAEVLRLKLAEADLLVALLPVAPETAKKVEWPWSTW